MAFAPALAPPARHVFAASRRWAPTLAAASMKEPQGTSSSSSSSVLGSGPTWVSESRLREFLDAEITHFALKPRRGMTLQDLLQASATPRQAAVAVSVEIPKRYASRVRQIEELPGWRKDEALIELHSRYSESFREMRMVEIDDELTAFTEVVKRLKERQRPALPLIGKWLARQRKAKAELDHEFWSDWVELFLRSRVTTEMLTSQYLAVVEQLSASKIPVTGIVDPFCDPAAVCAEAAKRAGDLCAMQTAGFRPGLNIEVRSKISTSFSFIPYYLQYILCEVFKDSFIATARASMLSTSLSGPDEVLDSKKIHVVICSDDHRVAIRVRDVAGDVLTDRGFDWSDRTWDFFHSSNKCELLFSVNDLMSPTSGYGLGLPLARLYAEYLGGSLSLQCLPGYGADFHLFLPRIDVAPFVSTLQPEAPGEPGLEG